MNNDMKRRSFIAVAVGALLGAPIAVHLMRGEKGKKIHSFTRELNRMQDLTRASIQPMAIPSTHTMTFSPPIGTIWNYALFSPAFLPKEFSHALGAEPDMFLAREGQCYLHRTNRNQTVLSGGDTNFMICSPTQTENRPKAEITLLVDRQQFHLARPKDQTVLDPDRQFVHLLSLPDMPQEWGIGKKWKSNTGRVRPFTGYTTNYEIVGFAEVEKHQTIQVRFQANIPNIAQVSGVTPQKVDKDASMTNTHKGNAWFDLTTGFLVRQEVEMTTVCRGKEIVSKDKSNTLTFKADSILQLTTT